MIQLPVLPLNVHGEEESFLHTHSRSRKFSMRGESKTDSLNSGGEKKGV